MKEVRIMERVNLLFNFSSTINIWKKSWKHMEGHYFRAWDKCGARRGALCPYSYGAFPMKIATLFRSPRMGPNNDFQSRLYRFLVSQGKLHRIRNTA